MYDSIYMKFQNKQIHRQKIHEWLSGAEAMGEWEVNANGHEVYFGGDENILKLDSNDSYTTL